MTAPATASPGEQPDVAGGDRPRWWLDALSLALVLAVVVAVPLLGRDVPLGSDPVRYLRRAEAWPEMLLSHQQLRAGLMLPLHLLTSVLGVTQSLFHAVATGLTAMWAAGVWALGRVLGGRVIATVAAITLTLHPVVIRSESYRIGGQIMPDTPAAALVTLGIALVLVAMRHEHGPRAGRWLLAGGTCLGLAYLFREYAPLFSMVVVLVLALYRRPWRELVVVAIPSVVVLVAETILHAVVFGQPFVRFVVSGSHGRIRTDDPIRASEALTKLPEALLAGPDDLAALALGAAMVAVVVAGAVTRRRDLVLLGGWIVACGFLLTLAAGLVRPGQPLLPGANLRYWTVLLPPAVVGSLLLARDGWRSVETGRAGIAARAGTVLVAVVVVATSVAGVGIRAQSPTSDDEWSAFREWLRANGDEVAVLEVDSWAAETIQLFRRDAVGGRVIWDGWLQLRGRDEAPDLEALRAAGPDSYVLITRWQVGPFPHLDREDARLVFRTETGWLRLYEVLPGAEPDPA